MQELMDRGELLRDEAIHREALRSAELFEGVSANALELNRLFVRCHRDLAVRSEASVGRQHLGAARGALLALLHRTGRGMTIMEVAEVLDVTPPAASKLAEALEKHGWVERSANPDDARSVLLLLTRSGRREAEASLPEMYARVTASWSDFSDDEQVTLIHLLTKLRLHLRAQG